MKQKYLVLWCVSFFSLSIFSQIVNEGALKIKPSTSVYFGDNYTNKSLATHSNDGNLYLKGDFVNNGTTESTAGTTFFNSNSADIQNLSGTSKSINFYNLEVNMTSTGKKGLSVADEFGLTVQNTLNLVSGDLRLNGDSQLLQSHTGSNANPIGLGKLLIDQQGIASSYGFNYWSSPVNNSGYYSLSGGLLDGTDATINPFTPQQVLFNWDSNNNGTPSTVDGGGNVITALSVNRNWLYKHYQPSGWININESTNLTPGVGYTMKGSSTTDSQQNYVFKGDTNNGDYQISVNSGEFLLIGNPYPCAIDANKYITDNLSLFDGTLYFWVDGGSNSHFTANYLGGYALRNLVTGTAPSVPAPLIAGLGDAGSVTPPTQYIDVAQGFFIESTANGNMTFDNSQRIIRTASSGSVNFYRVAEENSIIKIGYEDPEGFHRQLALGFMPNSGADMNYNPGYDAIMIDPREDELFFIIENDLDKKYVIQGVGAFEETVEIPLGFIMTEAGTHTIMLDELENFTHPVYIKDNVLNMTYNLTEGNYNPAVPLGSYFDRFSLVFQPLTLSTDDSIKNFIHVHYSDNTLLLRNPNSLRIEKVIIYNEIGQVLQTRLYETIDENIIIPFGHKPGLYLVNLKSGQKVTTFKILKN